MKKTTQKNRRPVVITIISVVLLAALIIAGAGSRRACAGENAVGTVLSPVQSFASRVSGAIAGFFSGIFRSTDADKQNAQLINELAMKNRSLQELEELKLENERLRDLLGYVDSAGIRGGVTARVIGTSTEVYFRVFTVNAGRSSGVDVDMPVVGADGLIGIVTQVGANWCKVTACVDSTMSIPIMIERTRDICMLRGVMNASNTDDRMELYYLPADRTDLIPGDVVITSGIGGVFPKGLRVGTVSEVMTAAKNGVNALVVPSSDLMHVEEVYILTGSGEN